MTEMQRLRAENAALRDLIRAAQEHANLAAPADLDDWGKHENAAMNRLLDLEIWLSGEHEEGCSVIELQRAARRIRERTARPLRYTPAVAGAAPTA